MKLLVALLACLISSFSFAQKIYRDRQTSIAAIENSGNSIHYFDRDTSVFYYFRYDENGEAQIIYKTDGDVVKKVMWVVRAQDVLAKITLKALSSAISLTMDKDIQGVFIAAGTCYYIGKARYEGVTDSDPIRYHLDIVIL
jgi:hypothetical protein